MKKLFIVTGIVLIAIFSILLTIPFLFKDEIKEAVLTQANKELDATIGLADIQLSFIHNFPNVSIKLEDLSLVGKGDFSQDTLFTANQMTIVVDIKSFFGDKGYVVNKIYLGEPIVNAHVLKDGRANWNIVRSDTTSTEAAQDSTTNQSAFNLSLKKLTLKDARILYNDEQANVFFKIDKLNHTLSGDMTAESTILETTNNIERMTLKMENVPYLNNARFVLDGDIKADLTNMVFTVSDVNTRLNAISLNLDGWFQVLENGGYDMDMKVDAPNTKFKDILSLIPAIYSNNFADIETDGKVKLDAYAKGIYNEKRLPAFALNLLVSDASFKYPALPKSVDDINISAKIMNPGGDVDLTKIDVRRFAFSLGGNPFQGDLKLSTPVSDPDVEFFAKGKLNLGMIKEVYPMDSIGELSGVVDADLKLSGKMSYYEKKMYEKFFFDGKLVLSDMVFDTKDLPHKLQIITATLVFNPKYVDLPMLDLVVGGSDLTAKGHLDNFIPYVLKDETLKATLETNSYNLDVADFMSNTPNANKTVNRGVASGKSVKEDDEAMSVVLIPSNLDFTLKSKFRKIKYDKIDITNAQGTILMADSKLTFKNLSLSAMEGSVLLNGIYNTQNEKEPLVDIDLNIKNVDFDEVYRQVETVKKFAPIFEKTDGKFSATMALETKLGNDMMPIIPSLEANGVLESNNLEIKNVEVLGKIAKVLRRDEFKDPEIKHVKVEYEIKKGRVYTKPFTFKVADTEFAVENGSTGIDETIDYRMKVNMPQNQNDILKISKLGLRIGGTFSDPKVSIETKELFEDAVSTIKKQASKQMSEAGEVMKEQFEELKKETKENIAPELKKAGETIKEEGKKIFKNLFGN